MNITESFGATFVLTDGANILMIEILLK